jgi:gamma-glutamylputrescine oxidase
MNLSIWEKETFFAPQDVIIIGSGFVGLWTALQLKKKHPKRKVMLVDQGIIPTGASTRNAGFACFGSLTELIHDAQVMGQERMLEIVDMRYRGLEVILRHFKKSEIEWDSFGGYELIDESYGDEAKVTAQMDVINELLKPVIGKKHVFKFDNDQLETFGFSGMTMMVANKLEAQLHPAKLLMALQREVQSSGVIILQNVEVTGYAMRGKDLVLHTNITPDLQTDQLVVCNNAFAQQLMPALDVVPARGQVLVTSEIPNLKFRGCFHFDEGFYYFRNLGNKVLLGGARNKAFDAERTTIFGTTELIQDELERFLREHILPGEKFTIDHRWSGIMGMGGEKSPIIERLTPNICCAVRMSGMGVALAPIVSQKVVEMID